MTRILVVDDEQIVRDLTVEVLRRAGYDVVDAGGAEAALAVVAGGGIDCVVSDVVMPGLSGVELLRKLRERWPTLPVVLMTGGSPEPERTTGALDLGASAIVYKPFAHAELTDAVAAALAP